jgi:methionine S-methyltransferase
MIDTQLDAFLNTCKLSSEKAISALSSLVETIENPTTSTEGISILNGMLELLSNKTEEEVRGTYHFHFFDMEIPDGLNDSFHLKLLQLPSTFAPEEWSYTFFEGLSRYPKSEFHDKKMVELGCGNGWISLSMAIKYNCAKIYGLDINPKAILCSKLNLYLNAFDRQGQLKLDQEGRSLLEKVDFQISDLLSCFFEKSVGKFDVIIGCIPQVLAPEESIDNSKISQDANDEFLHSLSNYTSEQGYVEDKFGLGLIARSVEESIDLLKSDGKLILNLGERPRREVLERLVKRRGMLINRIWKRKVAQADDTDIDSLVRLEKEMNHHFEFYTDVYSDSPINARTAKLFASKGGTIYHNLSVYECTFDFYTETHLLFNELKNDLFSEAKVGLDLDYEDRNKKEEKIRFLAELVRKLAETNHFPYEDNQGEIEFRKSLSDFLSAYQQVHFTEENILIAPNLECLIENVVDIYQPKTIFLPEQLFETYSYLQQEDRSICTPNCSNELNALIEIIKPEIVVAKIEDENAFTSDSLQKLSNVCMEANTRLFLDISACFELSSSPESNGIFKFLTQNQLPGHVALICELAKNQIYSDLKTCFLISNNQRVLSNLRNAAEFSYSRPPYLSQLFYSILVKELTSFHMKASKKNGVVQTLISEIDSSFIHETKEARTSFNHAAIQGNELKVTEDTVRFDYGENELASPDDLKISILESFTRQHFTSEELNPQPQLATFVKERFGLNKTDNIYYGNGVAPLFAGIMKLIKEENGTLLLPQGAYGYFDASAKFYGVDVKMIPTSVVNDFILNEKELEVALQNCNNPWLFLNFPLINPTGAFWDDSKMEKLLNVKGIENTKLIIDTVFSGLEFQGIKPSCVFSKWEDRLKLILLGGISKEYSAGGIRFGFAVSNFACGLCSKLKFTPHYTVNFTVNRLLSKYNEGDDRINHALIQQINTLKKRKTELTELLQVNGWKVLPPQGGLFLVASPESLLGKQCNVSYQKEPVQINAYNITEVFHDKINFLINNDEWTGIPGYCRFVLSVEEENFREGMKRIQMFHQSL